MPNTAPPIQLLAGFDAAARHLSIKQAAFELHVTPSAISQQIKQLESHLGLKLFERHPRALQLTQAGSEYFLSVHQLLNQYHSMHERFYKQHHRDYLRVSMMSSIAHQFVIPALHQFQQQYPRLDLRIETTDQLVDLSKGDIDAAIRIGTGGWPDLEVKPLCSLEATLIASPQLLAQQPLQQPADMLNHTLITSREDREDWGQAADFFQLPGLKDSPRLLFDSNLASLTAISQGLGIGIGTYPIINHWVQQKKLVTPLNIRASTPYHLQLVYHKRHAQSSTLNGFYHWLKTLF